MSQPRQYLVDRYSYKVLTKDEASKVLTKDEARRDRDPLEDIIRSQIAAGNAAFIRASYSVALSHYLVAWGLLPKVVYPAFPIEVGQIDGTQLLGVDLLEPLIAASVQIHRFRSAVGPTTQIVPAISAPDELVDLTERYAGRGDRSARLRQLASAHLESGSAALAKEYATKP